MKVVHVECGRHLYGGAQQVLYLLRGLQGDADRHVLACPPGSAIAGAAAGEGIPIRSLPMAGDVDPLLLPRLVRLLRDERPDLVHLHSRRGADPWGVLAARPLGIPVVLSRRVDNPEPRWLVAAKYGLVSRVIAISEAIRHVLLREGVPPAKVVCVPSAVDTDVFAPGCDRPWFSAALGVEPGRPAVGMLAQFIPRKGHQVLLDAVPSVLAEHPRTVFLLFGKGPLQGRVREEVARRALTDSVRFPGFRADVARVLPCLDLLVHPAFTEGLGVALLQAASAGVPIVGTRVGGIPEVVEPGVNGLLVEPGDAPALARAICDLLADPGLARRLGAAGRARAVSRFGIGAMCAGNRAVYRAVLAEGAGVAGGGADA